MTAAGTTLATLASLADVDDAGWSRVNPAGAVDRGLPYLRFREYLEPGPSVVVTAADDRGTCGAVYATVTTPRSAMFSHPWKLLTGEQFARAGAGDDGPRREQVRLAMAVGGGTAGAGPAAHLTGALGEALVVRLFDSSDLLVAPDLGADRRAAVAAGLVAALQEEVARGAAGAVVFPHVHPGNDLLREALAGAGFVHGVVTAASVFEVPPVASYAELLASFRAGRRQRFVKEQEAFDAAGLTLATVTLPDHLDRLAELEAATTAAHGGTPDPAAIVRVRLRMVEMLGDAVRVPVAMADGTPVACGVHLVDAHDYFSLVYGCDYDHPRRSTAYMCLTYYEPIRFCIANGQRRLRLGFEAFEAKVLRGATVTPRETWVWVPDGDRREELSALLAFLDSRTRAHLDGLPRSPATA